MKKQLSFFKHFALVSCCLLLFSWAKADCTADTTLLSVNICSGNTYFFNGTNLNATGTYTELLQNAASCDSLIILDLTISTDSLIDISVILCDGQSYLFNGVELSTPGTYTNTFTGNGPCSIIQTLHLFKSVPISDTITTKLCPGDTFHFGTFAHTTAGTYTDTITAYAHCDSILLLNLTYYPVTAVNTFDTICTGNFALFRGDTLRTTGVYAVPFQSIHGCDSSITFNLLVRPVIVNNLRVVICPGSSYTFNDSTFTEAGAHTGMFQTPKGCDSTVNLTLSIGRVYADTAKASICQGESYLFYGIACTSGGYYYKRFATVSGCDSIKVLLLRVDTLNFFVTQPDDNGPVTATTNGIIQWKSCRSGNIIATDSTGTSTFSEDGEFEAIFTFGSCSNTTSCRTIGTGIEEGINTLGSAEANVMLYPNPVSSQLTVSYSNFHPQWISLYDINGNKLSEQKITPLLNVEPLVPGIYFIELKGEDGTARKRFVKIN